MYLPASEEGQGMVEYALVLALVAVVVIAILSAFGSNIGRLYEIVTGMSSWE